MLKRYSSAIVFFLFFILNSINISAQTKDRNYYLELSKALGYVYGINLSLDYAIDNFPEVGYRLGGFLCLIGSCLFPWNPQH